MKTSFKPCLPAIYSPETLVNVTHNITSLTNALTKSFTKILIIIRNVHVHNRQKKTSRQKTIHVSHPISFFQHKNVQGYVHLLTEEFPKDSVNIKTWSLTHATVTNIV